jgi:predicted SAM-dependent methyltransferase
MSSLLRQIYETSPQQIYRYFANMRRSRKASDFMLNYMRTHGVRKLHLGCGGNYMETWLNCDLIPDNDNIVLLDAGKVFPLPSLSFDYIFSEHLFEHLTFVQQLNFLKESFRILKPGGKIRIATPDFDFLAQLTENKKSEFQNEYLKWNFQTFLKYIPAQLMDSANINVYVINNYFRDWGHQLIHNKSSIKNLIEYCGFCQLFFESVGQSSDPVLANLEKHGAMITEPYNKYETMVVEAIKSVNKKPERV